MKRWPVLPLRNGWAQLGVTVVIIGLALLLDAWVGGGWDSVGWIAPVSLAVISVTTWVARRRHEKRWQDENDGGA